MASFDILGSGAVFDDVAATTAQHELGRTAITQDGKKFTYVLFTATTALGDACIYDTASTSEPNAVKPSAAATDQVWGIAHVAHASSTYGWLQTGGNCDSAKVAAGVVATDPLIPSGTAGTLDKNAAANIVNVVGTAMDNYSAGFAQIYINWR